MRRQELDRSIYTVKVVKNAALQVGDRDIEHLDGMGQLDKGKRPMRTQQTHQQADTATHQNEPKPVHDENTDPTGTKEAPAGKSGVSERRESHTAESPDQDIVKFPHDQERQNAYILGRLAAVLEQLAEADGTPITNMPTKLRIASQVPEYVFPGLISGALWRGSKTTRPDLRRRVHSLIRQIEGGYPKCMYPVDGNPVFLFAYMEERARAEKTLDSSGDDEGIATKR